MDVRHSKILHCAALWLLGAGLGLAQAQTTTVAGTMPGQFAVNESGAATYRIPIQIPPGVAGMEPKLELVYNSQGGNGLLGMGWSLSGLSAISRCPRTMGQDGVRGSLNYDLNDRYCMDGQRLILVSGTYGVAGSEYRTELDSFSRITASGTAGNGVASFTVQTKAGLTMEYGNTADSRIEAQGKSTIRVWALNKISDVKTNYMTFSYTEDSANGDFYPSRIDYAGNANAGKAPANSVQFAVETRPDVAPAYRAGSLVNSAVRLAGATTYAGSSPVMNYRLTYLGSGTAKSRVNTITECLPDGSCRTPISLAWKDGGTSYVYTSSLYYQSGNAPIYAEGNRIWFVDVNGDGLDDHVLRDSAGVINVALSNGSEFVYTPSFNYQSGAATLYGEANRFWFADVNGDGLADLVVRDSAGMINVALSTGSSFVAAPGFNFQSGASVSIYTEPNRIWFIDVNGDGRADHVLRDSNGMINVALSTGSSFVAAPGFNYQSGASVPAYAEANRIWFTDVNGDGLPDHVMRDSAGVINVAVSTGSSFVAAPGFNYQSGASVPAYTEANRIWFIDINGDGMADHVMRDSAGVINVALSTGLGFVAAPGFNYQSGASVPAYTEANRIWFVDVNGDGLPDHVLRDSAGSINVSLSTGTGFVAAPSFTFGAGGTSPIYSEANRMWFADVNGDGLPDHILRDSAGGTMVRLFSPARGIASHLQSISNSAVTSLTYKPLTDQTVYTKDVSPNVAAYPKLDLQYAQYVVSTVASSNGIGGTVTTQYNYGGLKAEQGTGRGMLGFRWMQSKNLANNIESYTEFNQSWPFTGSVAKSETRLAGSGNAGVLKRTTNTYAQGTGSATGTTFVYPSQSAEESWDLGGVQYPTVTNAYQYGQSPQYGDPTQITVSNSAGAGKTTVNEYWPANTGGGNWILGRLKKATVTSTAP
jgi:hypothetical protein